MRERAIVLADPAHNQPRRDRLDLAVFRAYVLARHAAGETTIRIGEILDHFGWNVP